MPTLTPLISVNGVLDATISPLDRGLAYGDGLFETCRLSGGKIPLWRFHVARLMRGCDHLKIPVNRDLLEAYRDGLMDEAKARGIADGVLKVIVTRGGGGRGYCPPQKPHPTLCLFIFPSNEVDITVPVTGAAVRVCAQKLSANESLAGLKHLNRLDYVLARAEWGDDYQEGLLLDENDHVIEATAHNVFLFHEGKLLTPDLSKHGVAGIMRQIIIEHLAPALGLPVVIVQISLSDVCDSTELLLCNSVKGISSVARIESHISKNYFSETHTRALQQELKKFIQSENDQAEAEA